LFLLAPPDVNRVDLTAWEARGILAVNVPHYVRTQWLDISFGLVTLS